MKRKKTKKTRESHTECVIAFGKKGYKDCNLHVHKNAIFDTGSAQEEPLL
ncbi:unnamed protein product, partial [Musa hybrid cultivar]